MAKLSVLIVGNASQLEAALAKSAAAADGFGGKMQSVGSKLSSVGKTMTTHLTLPIVGIGAASVYMATKFQSSMELLSTQAGVPQKQIEGLSQSVLKLAGPVATAPDQLAQGLFHLASQGLRGAQSMDALKVAAEGAKVGQADLEDVTNALGAVIVAKLVPGVNNFGKAMGELNAIVGAGDMHMQDLADAMGTGLAAVAKTAHVSLDQVGGALATFGDNNIRGAKAGTLLISTMRVLGHQSDAGAAALENLGVQSSTLQNKLANGGLTAAIGYLKDQIDKSGKSTAEVGSDLSEAFGGKQSTGIKVLVDELTRLNTKVKDVRDGGNQFAGDWSKYTQTTAYKMDQMGASMQAAGISIGDILLPIVSKLVNKISDLTQWFTNLSPGVKKVILIFGGLLAAAGPILGIIGSIVTVVGSLSLAIALPVAAAVAFIAVLVLMYQHSETFRNAVQNLVAAVKSELPEMARIATAAIHALEPIFKDIVKVISDVINLIADLIRGKWGKAWADFKKLVVDGVHLVIAWLSLEVKAFLAIATAIGDAVINGIVAGLRAGWGLIKKAIDYAIIDPINWLIGKWNSIHFSFGGLDIFGHHIGAFDIGVPKIPSITPLASGGIVTGPTLALIGESGPEAVVPLSRGGLGGGVNVTVNVTGFVGNDMDIAKKVGTALATQLRGNRVPQLTQAIQSI